MEKKQDSLIKITDLTARLGLSSRSLRYYEQVGLIKSCRTGFDKYRYYNEENIERLKQIMVLRKMQIPIKDILRIYENEDMSVVVDIFVKRINSIDDEIGALEELKGIISDFLRFMQKNGVTKISVIPILYEEMEKQFKLLEREKTVSYNDLSKLSGRLAHPVDPAIISLPPMRVVSSLLKENPKESDTEGFWRWLQEKGLKKGAPGDHMQFEYQLDNVEVILQRIPDDYVNDGIYYDFVFDGGLFASINVFLDEDLAECFQSLIKSFDDNKFYMIDYTHSGELRHPALLESLISPDVKRELVALLIPVKKRKADSSLFSLPEEQTDISVNDLEAANPVLWELNLSPDKLIQTHKNFSDYHINDDGEGEYISRVIRAILKTNVSVKLPFRVDIEFRQSGQGKTGILFYHSEDIGYHTGGAGIRSFGINMGNDNEKMVEAIHFHQPIFWDSVYLPGYGRIKKNEINRVSWIVGEKHLAVIINDEVRYCGKNFPYMSLDLSLEKVEPIVIGIQGSDKMMLKNSANYRRKTIC